MSCPSPVFSGGQVENTSWENWSGRVSGSVNTFFVPSSLPDLVNIVGRASQEGRRVHVVGSGWAFEDMAYSPDWMVSLVQMKRSLSTVIPVALNANWANRSASAGEEVLFHVEAGATVADVNDSLAAVGLALPTLGGANGQAIGGVISTSTHGCDIDFPPFPDLVMAMHLVTIDGREIWVERATQPITDDVPLAIALDCKDAEILRSDELFDALLVGFGRFGIVYSYVLRVRSAFRLAEWTVKLQRGIFTGALRLGLIGGNFLRPLFDLLPPPPDALGAIDVANPRSLEVVFDSLNTGECFVRRRWLTANTIDLNLKNAPNQLCELGAGGVLTLAEVALTGLQAAPPWVLIPFWPAIVEVRKAQIAANLATNPNTTAGEMLAIGLNSFWDLNAGAFIPLLTGTQFNDAYKDSMGEGRRGRSDLIASGFREQSLQTCYRAVSIEPIFDAHLPDYLDFLDAIIAAAPNSRQAGYFSLRWSASSKATLSMHNVPNPHAIAIEVTSLKGLPDNESWIQSVEEMAISYGGRPHWGQQNRLSAEQISVMFGTSLTSWRSALTALLGGSQTFSTAHTLQKGLEPTSDQAKPTLFGRKASELVADALGPVLQLLLSPPEVVVDLGPVLQLLLSPPEVVVDLGPVLQLLLSTPGDTG
jgi:FAD binding domain/D-arabinono-1,4-lactone oxidase